MCLDSPNNIIILKPSSEENALQDEIKQLNKEAEKYNNPSEFAKYGKIQRKISQLEKQLNQIKIDKGEDVSFGLFNSLFSEKYIQFSYFKTFLSFFLFAVKIYFIYFLSDKKLYFKDYNYSLDGKENIIFEHLRDSEGFINIPVRFILIIFWTLLF